MNRNKADVNKKIAYKIADRSLHWLLKQQKQFTLPPGPQGYLYKITRKALYELALTAHFLIISTSPSSYFHQQGKSLLYFCWKEFQYGQHFKTQLLLGDMASLIKCSYYGLFYIHGIRNLQLEEQLMLASKTSAFKKTILKMKKDPTMLMITISLMELIGIPLPLSLKEAFQLTFLFARPVPLMKNTTGYILTHDVFSATSIGMKPGNLLTLKHRQYLQKWASEWIRLCILQKNYDLLAEMIMTLTMINAPIKTTWLCQLKQAQTNSGFIITDYTKNFFSQLIQKTPNKKRRFVIRHYHPTLTTLMAAILVATGK